MKSKKKINDISSTFCLKNIFSYLDYEYILKLIKYNKELQNRLGLKKENYEIIFSYEYVIRKIIKKIKNTNNCELYKCQLYISIISFVSITYILKYDSNLHTKGSFNATNLKKNYDENLLNIIKIINDSLLLLTNFIFISFFVIIFFVFKNFYFEEPKLKKIKLIILLIINLFYFFYEIIIIWKLYLSYKIKNNNFPWFMVYDYILISLILLDIIFLVYITVKYIKYAGSLLVELYKIILKRYKNIKIIDFELPKNFLNMTKIEKRKFIKNNANQFQHAYTKKNIDLMNKINEFRSENNVHPLYYEEESKLPDFLIHENSEVILFDYKNTFKLSNRNYLLKYKVNSFEQNFDKNNVDKNIILSEDIIRISAIDIGEYEYIYFSEDTLFGPISLNEAKNEFPNKDIYDYFIKDISYKE